MAHLRDILEPLLPTVGPPPPAALRLDRGLPVLQRAVCRTYAMYWNPSLAKGAGGAVEAPGRKSSFFAPPGMMPMRESSMDGELSMGQRHRPHPLPLTSTTQKMWHTFNFACSPGTGCT